MRVLLVDSVSGGHHDAYAATLAKELVSFGMEVSIFGPSRLIEAVACSTQINASFIFDEPSLVSEKDRFYFVKRAVEHAQAYKADILHFLYLDRHILAMSAALLARKELKIRATLHWAYFLKIFAPSPVRQIRGKAEIAILRLLSLRGLRVMCHSPTIRDHLRTVLGRAQADYVPYPLEPFVYNSACSLPSRRSTNYREKLGLCGNDILLLAFGGTRYDKGADLAVKALSHLPSRYHLLIAGKPETFGYERLMQMALDNGVERRLHLKLEHVTDTDMLDLFLGSDIVILPYRRLFAGQSGPLTIAAALGIPVVATNVAVLRETVERYGLGALVEPENPADLSRATLDLAMTHRPQQRDAFVQDHNPEAFGRAVLASYSRET